jgi:ATP-dependent helicase/nuclease subunit B
MPEARGFLGAEQLVPAGVFYIPLRPKLESLAARAEPAAEDSVATANALSFQHRGRFDAAWLPRFDDRGTTKGDQFRFTLKRDGTLAARGNDALPAPDFPELVQAAEARLRQIGERIYSGEAVVSPYRHKQQTACDLCPYRSGCRFDPWVTSFRSLKGKEGED